MPTVRLNNGNIEADGSLNALSVTTREIQTDNLNVTGQLTASGDIAANRITGDVNVTGTVNTSEVNADSLNVSGSVQTSNLSIPGTLDVDSVDCGTLNVSGDLIAEGEDDRILGESFQSLTGNNMQVKHNVWYHSGTTSSINVLADTDSGRVKTCYLIACPTSPLVLNGVDWLYAPVGLEDSSKTHVIALQQIGAGPVMANLAYSYPV